MNKGFTLVELVITTVIMGMLAAVTIPTYKKLTAKSQVASSEADLEAIKKAFINYYYESMLSGNREFPPGNSGDNTLDTAWGNLKLYNKNNASTLFSEGEVPSNPKKHFYVYSRLTDASDGNRPYFTLGDPDYKLLLTFKP